MKWRWRFCYNLNINLRLLGGGYMIKVKKDDINKIKEILGRIYLDNGVTDEVILLSKAVDKIILSRQKNY